MGIETGNVGVLYLGLVFSWDLMRFLIPLFLLLRMMLTFNLVYGYLLSFIIYLLKNLFLRVVE